MVCCDTALATPSMMILGENSTGSAHASSATTRNCGRKPGRNSVMCARPLVGPGCIVNVVMLTLNVDKPLNYLMICLEQQEEVVTKQNSFRSIQIFKAALLGGGGIADTATITPSLSTKAFQAATRNLQGRRTRRLPPVTGGHVIHGERHIALCESLTLSSASQLSSTEFLDRKRRRLVPLRTTGV
jgi:hypothetical protein